jgi:4-hydroxybenzoate polyprenyltransferase
MLCQLVYYHYCTHYTAIMTLLFSLLDIMFMCLCFAHKRTLKNTAANTTTSTTNRLQQRKAAKIGLSQLYVYHAFAAIFSLLNISSKRSGGCYIGILAVMCVVISTSITLSRNLPLQTSAYTVCNNSSNNSSTAISSSAR